MLTNIVEALLQRGVTMTITPEGQNVAHVRLVHGNNEADFYYSRHELETLSIDGVGREIKRVIQEI